ncbi:hypothetical protein [Deinococcus roseus]|uniref:Lipoprotein n=1 Tax=Deinococcus roseus TaxID=392414 RepID=A0ABQ2DHL0_9DEIO|nr:hypothetical protein [Deinococcus roseus]GGJ55666.1 hypothetical protein GCM10008938_47300 [Deinococcus roseus]
MKVFKQMARVVCALLNLLSLLGCFVDLLNRQMQQPTHYFLWITLYSVSITLYVLFSTQPKRQLQEVQA